MGFTRRELIEFLDGLVESASEENKATAAYIMTGSSSGKCSSKKLKHELECIKLTCMR